jgi:hypothetical protein
LPTSGAASPTYQKGIKRKGDQFANPLAQTLECCCVHKISRFLPNYVEIFKINMNKQEDSRNR